MFSGERNPTWKFPFVRGNQTHGVSKSVRTSTSGWLHLITSKGHPLATWKARLMHDFGEVGLMELAQSVLYQELGSSSKALGSFQWGGTVSALFLLLMNRIGRRSHTQTNLLVLYLFTSFPNVLFKILRGQFGRWVAFLAVGANLFFPRTIPASRFILFVITPEWLANGLRDDIVGGFFCLMIGVLLVVTELRGIGGFRNCECTSQCFGCCLGIGFLFFFTILYLCKGTY